MEGKSPFPHSLAYEGVNLRGQSFETTLLGHFEHVPGRTKIIRKEHACRDRFAKLEVDQSRSYEQYFLPGKVIDMSMSFRRAMRNACPSCQLETNEPLDVEYQW